jgi:hypothetical protein
MNLDINICDLQVKTISKNDLEYSDYIERTMKFCDLLIDDNLAENYTQDNLKIDEWLALTIIEYNTLILGFSTIAWRPCFYSGVRILNRFAKHPNFRFVNKTSLLTLETKKMILQQIEMIKSLNFKYAFVSRSAKHNSMAHYLNYISEYKWNHEFKRYKVCEADGSRCCQMVSWTSLSQNAKIDLRPCND